MWGGDPGERQRRMWAESRWVEQTDVGEEVPQGAERCTQEEEAAPERLRLVDDGSSGG